MSEPNPDQLILAEADETIGIPHVPAMVWQAEQERSRQMVLEGKCPLHHDLIEKNELSYTEDGECPYCERGE